MSEDNFFKDAWQEITSYQNEGETFADHENDKNLKDFLNDDKKETPEQISKQVEIYKLMEKISAGNPDLQALFDDIKDSVLRYIETIDKLSLSRERGDDQDMIIESDSRRTQAHEVLISNLNILSRLCSKLGLDNEWRSMIGLDRKQVTDWALDIFPLIIKGLDGKDGQDGRE
jgi:hypothetical protein